MGQLLVRRRIGIIILVAEDTKKCYCIHRQWRSPYLIVLCGNLTIPYCGRFFHCFLLFLLTGGQNLKTAPQPWQAIAQRFCSIGIWRLTMVAIIGAGVFSIVIVLSFLIACGFPLGELTMGGQYKVFPKNRVGSASRCKDCFLVGTEWSGFKTR